MTKFRTMRPALVLIMYFLSHAATAQPSMTKNDLLPRVGDRLTSQEISFLPQGDSGEGVVWDFSDACLYDAYHRTCYYRLPSHPLFVTGIADNVRHYYLEQGDTLVLSGKEDNLSCILYDAPIPCLTFPLSYGSDASGYFHGRGSYCERTLFWEYGSYRIAADATGSLVLPGRDTLHNVVRHHSTVVYSVRNFRSDSIRAISDMPPFCSDSVADILSNDTLVIQNDVYRWYVSGSRSPIVETRISSCNGRVTGMKSFVIYPADDSGAADDPVQYIVRKSREPETMGRSNNMERELTSTAGSFRYETVFSDATCSVILEPAQSCNMVISLYTENGSLVWTKKCHVPESNHHKEVLPTDMLPQGIYILAIEDDKEKITEKITLKR